MDVLVFEATDEALNDLEHARGDDEVALTAVVGAGDARSAETAVRIGVGAVLMRTDADNASLLRAIRGAIAGDTILPSGLLDTLLDRAARTGADTRSLTDRELDVLRLLADGGDTREIAAKLSYSERTVKGIVHDLLVKLNCRNRAHAVAVAAREGLI